jgi:hypothetical protein
MSGLGSVVSVADLSRFFNLSRSSVYGKIRAAQSIGFPKCIPGKTMRWLKDDVEPFFIIFQTFHPSAKRVREKFGKVSPCK